MQQHIRDIKHGNTQTGSQGSGVLARLRRALITFITLIVVGLGILAVLGFSTLVGGPYAFFQVLFVIACVFAIPPLIFFIASYHTLRRIHTQLRTKRSGKQRGSQNAIHVTAEVVQEDTQTHHGNKHTPTK